MIAVTLTDGCVYQYNDIDEAIREIEYIVIDSDFDITIITVEEVDSTDRVIQEYECEWSLNMVPI